MRDEELRLEQLHLNEENEQKAKPSGNQSNLKFRKPTTAPAKASLTSNIQIVQPMQLDTNSSSITIPTVRTNHTTKLRSIAAHNLRNNYSNTATNTSSNAGSSAGKF